MTHVIRQDLECLADLLELLFGGRNVILVSIRVPFQCLKAGCMRLVSS